MRAAFDDAGGGHDCLFFLVNHKHKQFAPKDVNFRYISPVENLPDFRLERIRALIQFFLIIRILSVPFCYIGEYLMFIANALLIIVTKTG
jgi:hypothetical protein